MTYALHAVAALDRARVAVPALGGRNSGKGKGRDDSKTSEHGGRCVRDGEVERLERLRLREEAAGVLRNLRRQDEAFYVFEEVRSR